MTDVGQLREGSSVNSPEEEPSPNAKFHDHKDKAERLEVPAADLPSERAEVDNADEEPPGPPDLHLETTPEPLAMEPPTGPLVPTPQSEEVGIVKRVETSEQSQAVFGIAEVR